ncbi:molybdate ABC transporter permease [Kordiimonas sediminis]|uniref:Molybdenum transport system permease n=1 Tax=Kordiimonas sediminis TaxID=1735581 RepID=A0A919AVV3_9PROT|nr:molybdate ABC transporter permease subunit [Kordiimonas sediminis]GHF25618.1 molybdate ABC transporter permease [Kordiimonas sediminis]
MITPAEGQALWLSVKVALVAVTVALPFAVFVAYAFARWSFPFKSFLNVLVHIPLVVPPVVIGYLLLVTTTPTSKFGGWLSDLGLNPSFTWGAAAIASGVMAFPLMVRAVRQAFESQPIALTEIAETLGASRYRRFLTINLPLAVPGILTATVLGFGRAIGEFGATITFAANIPGVTQTLPLALYTAAQSPGGEEAAFRLTLLCLIPAVISLITSEWLTRRHYFRNEQR